ncbi:helix-turn-helix domain-containing protein [Acidithrix ferrooxidans]|uniref:Anaerobic benzoate catabolism transcriptional regulator n=1 Tax=Acidithrix ferrooxidans TaxID=1280514 RepID=A0A0D8HGJ0_9ACTN|nr:helix-turn-helix transcriptional regulator [Acidithrix ferrooxidans]KJF16964.1 anaerobic benzoate catabolism transcriptional regulator [Acidithrix ferrooxidans]
MAGGRLTFHIPPNTQRAKIALGKTLRSLRVSRSLTSKQLGERVGFSQSHVSKIENGHAKLTRQDLDQIAKTLELTVDEETIVVRQFELTLLPPLSMRAVIAHGVENRQRQIRDYEKYIRVFDQYEPTVIPGLLQLPGYTRELLRWFEVPENDIEAAISGRRERQEVLTQRQRSFHFVIAESVLYTVVSSREVQVEQLRWLSMHIKWDNVRIGILPTVRGNIPGALTGFTIYDGRFVSTETVVIEQFISNADSISTFVRLHTLVAERSVYGQEALEMINRATTHLELNCEES